MTKDYVIDVQSEDQAFGLGVLVAVLSAVSFGVVTTFAKISYDGGANAITFAVARAVVMSGVVMLPIIFLKREWRVPKSGLNSILFVIAGQAGLSICILSAVQFIPVTLALLIMYIYPALVLVVEAVILREALRGLHVFACLCAFVGLGFVLGPSLTDLDWRGVAFAVGACISLGTLMLAMRSARQHVNEVTAILWGNLGSLPVIVAFWPLLGGIALPGTQIAWLAMAAGIFLFVFGFSGYAISLRYIRAGRAAMIYNFEPLSALIAAALILGESLLLSQLLGAALVFTSILVAARK